MESTNSNTINTSDKAERKTWGHMNCNSITYTNVLSWSFHDKMWEWKKIRCYIISHSTLREVSSDAVYYEYLRVFSSIATPRIPVFAHVCLPVIYFYNVWLLSSSLDCQSLCESRRLIISEISAVDVFDDSSLLWELEIKKRRRKRSHKDGDDNN